MTSKIKNITLLIFLIACVPVFSQSSSKDKTVSDLSGKWRLEYENENIQQDTVSIVSKRIIKIKKYKGKEIGYFKDGQTITNTIKWSFIDSDDKNKQVIVFNGGIWLDEQEFTITDITLGKISMLSCDKYDDCVEVYFIRE